jgi:hypothetical protein
MSVLYSAVFGGYDKLRPVLVPGEAYRFVALSDTGVCASGWDCVRVNRRFENPARDNRFYKLQPHLHFPGETCVYMDASMQLNVSPDKLLEWWIDASGCDDADLYAIEHPLGHTWEREIDWVANRGMVDLSVLRAMHERYLAAGVPRDKIGIEARLMVARPSSAPFFTAWWGEVRDFAHRDQVSFHYARHVAPIKIATVPMSVIRPLFKIHPHTRPQLVGAK